MMQYEKANNKRKFQEEYRHVKKRLKGGEENSCTIVIMKDFYCVPNKNFRNRGAKTVSSLLLLPSCKSIDIAEQGITTIGNQVKNLKFITYSSSNNNDDNGECNTLSFPEEMARKLIKFFKIRKLPENFDCGMFARYLIGESCRYYQYDPWITDHFNKGIKIEESQLSSGDIIFIEDGDGAIQHWAIYIGEGLYISKFGRVGKVGIATLAEMRKLYYKCDDNLYTVQKYDSLGTKRQRKKVGNLAIVS